MNNKILQKIVLTRCKKCFLHLNIFVVGPLLRALLRFYDSHSHFSEMGIDWSNKGADNFTSIKMQLIVKVNAFFFQNYYYNNNKLI